MPDQILNVDNLSKSFAGVRALQGVNLTMERGEIRCLVGENGCGKSTLIKVIAGVVQPDEGTVTLNGRQYRQIRPIDAIREGIQVIYQDFSLFPNLTVAENIAFNYNLARKKQLVNWRDINRIAREAIAKIGVDLDLGAYVEDLPVADKQIIAICRAISQSARLVIMDEPTTALTEKEVRALFNVIKTLQREGIAILFVSHKLNEVLEISEKITIMRNGRNVTDGNTAGFDRASLVKHMTGREINETNAAIVPQAGNGSVPLLQAENLSCRGRFADVSFSLAAGEIIGITGLLGSGRTELALSLFGIRPADAGTISIEGRPAEIRSVQDAVRHGIGYVPEDRLIEGLFLERSIGSNIVAGTLRRLTRRGLINRTAVGAQIRQWTENLHINTPSPELPVKSLSGGNQQRVVLAKWLAINPKILIMNGPTVGVDVGSKAEIHQIIRDLARQGIGVIIISDDLPELLQNCCRILVMRKGRVLEELPTEGLSEADLTHRLSATAPAPASGTPAHSGQRKQVRPS